MSIAEKKKAKFEREQRAYEVKVHPQTSRLYHIQISKEVMPSFWTVSENDQYLFNIWNIHHMPTYVASYLLDQVGEEFGELLRNIVHDRESGGFTLGLEGVTKIQTNLLSLQRPFHILGIPNHDAMSGKYYARFSVKDTDNSDSYLRQAYRLFTFHTDGTFVDEPTDWLLMMKMVEQNARGGESRLLHLDDWKDLDKY